MSKTKPIIFWSAGHGKKGSGAVGYVDEALSNIKVVNYGCEYLQKNYVCTVYKDITTANLNEVIKKANKLKADFCHETHFNSGKGNGYESLVYAQANVAMGKVFEKHMKAIGQNSRGTKLRPDLGFLRETYMPALISEVAFVDNKTDIKDFDEDHELKEAGIALAKATAEYLKLKKKVSNIYITLYDMNVRLKPDIDYSYVTMIPKGTKVNITSVNSEGWGKVTYNTRSGYIRVKGTKQYCKKV